MPLSLHLTDNLSRTLQRLYHLLALLAAADGVVALLEQVVQLALPIQVLEQLLLHLLLGEPNQNCQPTAIIKIVRAGTTYWTRFSIIAFGTMSIMVRLTMLK